eukprot:scaffold3305_cov153-Cylindrotheca_fusiformis.AAC.1
MVHAQASYIAFRTFAAAFQSFPTLIPDDDDEEGEEQQDLLHLHSPDSDIEDDSDTSDDETPDVTTRHPSTS